MGEYFANQIVHDADKSMKQPQEVKLPFFGVQK